MSAPPYTEVSSPDNPYPKGEWYQNEKAYLHFRARRLLKCAWTDRAAMIGWLYSEAGAAYPHADGVPWAVVRNVLPLGRGATGGITTLISHSECLLEVHYDSDGPKWTDGQYVEEELSPEWITIEPPGFGLHWQDGPFTDDDRILIQILGWVHILRIGRASSVPSNVMNYIDCCNGAPKSCLTLPYSFPSQTVLYCPPIVNSGTEISEATKYYYEYHHLINTHEWNKYFNTRNMAWEKLYTSSDEQYVRYKPYW